MTETPPDGAVAPPGRVVELEVNGETHSLPEGSTVRSLLASLAIDSRRIAVAVNRDVVPRSEFETHPLAEGDHIEILEAVGGG